MEIVTTEELAQRLNISTDAVRKNVQKGHWPHLRYLGTRPYRFDVNQIIEIIKAPSSLTIQKSRRLSLVSKLRKSSR